MLSVIMLSVIYAECNKKSFLLSVVVLNVVMLSAVMLNAIMLNVVAPSITAQDNQWN